MNCQEVRNVLHAYVDRELDFVHVVAVEEHLDQCTDCSRLDQGVRSLKSAIARHVSSYRAPRELCVVPGSVSVATTRPPQRLTRNAMVAAAMSLVIGAAGFALGVLLNFGQGQPRIAESVVAAHIRSLQVEHAVDVASSDRHTVKPWFQGKVDYAPQVTDLSSHGFELHGGRLDYLIDRPVAAIIYFRRSHAINVFTWPVSLEMDSPLRSMSAQGFHIRTWMHSGMTYWAISDLNDVELDQFVELLHDSQPQTSRKVNP